jgi:hypothetical protein
MTVKGVSCLFAEHHIQISQECYNEIVIAAIHSGVFTMSKEDNIREILNDAVQEIVQVQNNPRSWLSWMVYLLAQFEEQATKQGHASRESYLDMLSALQDAIRNRTRTGGWN